jgi:hypothetical protein
MPYGLATAGDVLTAANVNLLPRGLMASASSTSSQATITTVTDLTGLTATWTAVTGRTYRITAVARITQSTTVGAPELSITTSANTVINRNTMTLDANETATLTAVAIVTGINGSVTYKARLEVGSGAVQTNLSSTQPSLFFVEDLGA